MSDPGKPTLYAIFGGICSGKTTVAKKLEEELDARVISKDRLIFQGDILARDGIELGFPELRRQAIANLDGASAILDETIRAENLQPFRQDYEIIAVFLRVPIALREKRLSERLTMQNQIVNELSALIGVDLSSESREKRRLRWRKPIKPQLVSQDSEEQLHRLLQTIYLSGSHFMKPEVPDPVEFPEVDFVAEFEANDIVDLEAIESRLVPAEYYARRRKGHQVKCCIWDIGGVLYEYSQEPLKRLTLDLTTEPSRLKERMKAFSFNKFMRGHYTFLEFVEDFAHWFSIPQAENLAEDVQKAMEAGVGSLNQDCQLIMQRLQENGILNALLSNALPNLEDYGSYAKQIDPDYRFYSFNTGYLKPEPEAYLDVLEKVGCAPSEVLFIDDKRRNTRAAEALGICSITSTPVSLVRDLRIKAPDLGI